jgi:putative ABC transport system substrate-binding protein
MNRRDALLLLAALGASGRAFAQPAKVRIIGMLDDAHESSRAAGWAAFRKRLQELGHAEAKGLRVEARFAKVNAELLPKLASELVALKVEVIVTASTVAALAAKRATSSIPIVSIGASDPINAGLVKSYSRPEGNITGVTTLQSDLVGKWLELIRELVPKAKSIGLLSYVDNPASMLLYRELQERARPLGLAIHFYDGTSPANVERAFQAMARDRVDALVAGAAGAIVNQAQQIPQAAARQRIPAIYGRRDFVDAGGLMSYAADYDALFPPAADYVHRILQGARPSQLPFESMSTYKLVLNVKAAKALGLKIPKSVRARVDEAIQ